MQLVHATQSGNSKNRESNQLYDDYEVHVVSNPGLVITNIPSHTL